MESKICLSRRAILVNGLRVFLASVLWLRFGGTAVSAEQKPNPRNPRLMDDQFNKRFSPLRGTPQFAAEMDEVKKDLAGYLAARFDVTPAQLQAIKAMPAGDVLALNAAVDRAVSEKLAFKLKGASTRATCGRMRPRFSGDTLTIEISAN